MKIHVTDRSGKKHVLDAIEGWRVMEIIRDHGMENAHVAIKAECGGSLACATCHVYVDKTWQKRLPSPSMEEIDMLDEAFNVNDDSRLSCQILMSEDLDGLEVTLANGTEP